MQLTPHFHLDEFMCHDGTHVPVMLIPNMQRLCTNALEIVRTVWAAPVVVISGYRTRSHNDALPGAAPDSSHLTAEAADIRCLEPILFSRFVACVEALIANGQLPELGGVGTYPGWVHLDVRRPKDGHLRRWRGKGLGSEPRLNERE